MRSMSASAKPSEPRARRRRRAIRVLATLLGVLVLLPALLVGAVLVGANTEPGRAAIARLASGFVDGLTIEGLQRPPARPPRHRAR